MSTLTHRETRSSAPAPTRNPDRAPTPTQTTTTVHAIAEHVVRLFNEVTAGVRPASQVTPLFRSHLRDMVRQAPHAPGAVARIRRLVITSHAEGIYEIVAVCARAGRVSALGLQLTRSSSGRWQVTDIAHPDGVERPAHSCPTRRGARAWDTTQRC